MSTTTTARPAPTGRHAGSRRRIATTVGILFVAQMVMAMVGTSLTEAFVDGAVDRDQMTLGVLLMMGSGLAVIAIGLLMYPVLKDVNPHLAVWYPVLRIAEFSVSAACGIYLLAQSEVVPNHMLWIYVPTGLGGIVLTYLLLVSGLVPRAIALLGLVGYVALTVGVPLDLLGVLDMGAGPGLLLVVPGGLFELVFLPAWLLIKGFRTVHAPQSRPTGAIHPAIR
ncbi:DUF4386 domain-containing protein [Mumia sp. zg.B21]|uniref:DUF4386 domain-containing protein n=1 Tax=Mumia sp. zg.B21 TaxID=2855447 RepID=UPI001C6E5F85|nr:DUF4386 domain-containing protein [Mumia sp. zg.B21]MBW9210174.1 DUF4386 domain-containing protein [Mumia sp. zg.B21]